MSTDKDAATRPALPVQLHAATREKHHALNVDVLAHLPQSLPPIASNSLPYATGMVVFGQVYFAFEDQMQETLQRDQTPETTRDIYQHIFFPRLLRTARLRADIDALKSKFGPHTEEGLTSLGEESKRFYDQVRRILNEKPHVILAYAWTMYLALFNGGRWIRKQLATPGPDFWQGDSALSFWDFNDEDNTESDEALKLAFKDGFSTAADFLSDEEKDDVIEGSKALFDLCREMIAFLDTVTKMHESLKPFDARPVAQSWWPSYTMVGNSIVAPVWNNITSGVSSIRQTAASAWARKEVSSE
ncbi:hypothetical protein B0A52_05404 [Exophiala mesophila]|uniref:Heme oxygenase-like protein n=1 Tax=Exophiala mesophila TaxID=212818 RepID=A0A438N502_EXOME|nr:hypothetical protein B0A52_05404 [Exophiala mesophila]